MWFLFEFLLKSTTMNSFRNTLSLLAMVLLTAFQSHAQTEKTSYGPAVKNKVHTDLNTALEKPDQVFLMDLSGQGLKEFPEEVFKFENLEKLDIRKNELTAIEIPDGVLPNLVWLNAAENKISRVEVAENGATNLKDLYLNFNALTSFPELSDKHRLNILDIRYNKIKKHVNRPFMREIKRYYADSNPIPNIQECLTMSQELEVLSIANIPLPVFPKVRLVKLQDLTMSASGLKEFRADVKDLPRLRFVDLSDSPGITVETLSAFSNFKYLVYINIDRCELDSLPASWAEMKSVEAVSAIGNNITELPNSWYEVKWKKLNLNQNPLNKETMLRLTKELKRTEVNL